MNETLADFSLEKKWKNKKYNKERLHVIHIVHGTCLLGIQWECQIEPNYKKNKNKKEKKNITEKENEFTGK